MVVQIDVRNLDVAGRQRVRIDGKAVVLRRDFDPIGGQVLHRVVGAVMAELQLERAPAQSQPADLMAQADSEDRDPPQELADVRDGVGHRLRVTGPVREKHAIGREREHVFGRGLRRDDGDLAVVVHQQPEDILLDAEIIGHHTEALGLAASGRFAHLFAPETRLASSSPAMGGTARASWMSISAGVPSVATTPRSAPTLRMWRTSARVSRSQITGILWRFRYSCVVSAERQFEETWENSRTMSDSM